MSVYLVALVEPKEIAHTETPPAFKVGSLIFIWQENADPNKLIFKNDGTIEIRQKGRGKISAIRASYANALMGPAHNKELKSTETIGIYTEYTPATSDPSFSEHTPDA